LVDRYGRDIIIIHGNEPGVDASFDAAAKEMGLNVETRVIDRKNTGFQTVGQRNRELLMGGADMYIAVHDRIASHRARGRSTAFCKRCRMESLCMGSRISTRSPGGSSEGIRGSGDLSVRQRATGVLTHAKKRPATCFKPSIGYAR
jgi:hypothetical protein